MPRPPEGIYLPTVEQFRWLIKAVHRIEKRAIAIMASLEELQGQVNTLQTSEATQSGILNGLTGVVDQLLDLVLNLRRNLSPEEQTVVDSAMATVADTLANSAAQSAELQDLSDKAAAGLQA